LKIAKKPTRAARTGRLPAVFSRGKRKTRELQPRFELRLAEESRGLGKKEKRGEPHERGRRRTISLGKTGEGMPSSTVATEGRGERTAVRDEVC